MDIDRTSTHYKGVFANIYEVNKKFPNGGTDGDYVEMDGWAHYWNADRGTWCVNSDRDSYWDEKLSALKGTKQIAEMDKAVHEVQQQAEASKAQIQALVNALPVVQQTGDSTTSVMSQKAVTEALKDASNASNTINLLGKPNDISVPTTVNVTNKDGSVPNKGFYTRDAAVGSVFAENTTYYAGIYSVKLALTKGQKITFRKETSTTGAFSNAAICNEKREVLANKFFSSGSSYTPTENGFLYCNFDNRESEAEVVFIEYETTISFLSNKKLENEINAVDKKAQSEIGHVKSTIDDYVIKTDVLQIAWHTDKLISYNSVINNKAWDGSFATAGGFSASDYFDVHDYAKIQLKLTLSANVNICIIIADRNKSLLKVIGGTDLSESYEIELPYGAYFMAISCQTGENKVNGVALSFVKRSEIVDDLNTDNEYYPLSANQGKVIGVAQSYTDSLLPQKKEILHDGYWRAVLFSINGKYFSVANVKKVIDQMHNVNLNKLMIDFSNDQGFRLSINTDDKTPSEMLINANGKTYDLTTALGDHAGVSNIGDPDGSNKWLTRADMTEIVNYASDRDIEIIPSFGFPNHMGAIIDTFSEFKFVTNRCCNFTTNEGRNFMLAILERYVDFFASLGNSFHFNIRGDELGGILNDARTRETFNAFINQCFRVIAHHKMIPLIYNDNIKPDLANGAYISDGFEVLHWWSWNRPEDLISKGYRLVNLNADTQYWVLGNTNNPTAETIKNKVDPRMFRSGLYAHGGLGSMLCFFTDKAYTDGADEGSKMTNDVLPVIKAFGEKMAEENNNVNIFSRTLDIVNPSENFIAKAHSVYFVDINIDERKNVTGKDGNLHLKKTGIRIRNLIGGLVNRNEELQVINITNVSAYLDKEGYLQEGVVRAWFVNTSENDIDVTPQNVTIKYYGAPSYYIVRI